MHAVLATVSKTNSSKKSSCILSHYGFAVTSQTRRRGLMRTRRKQRRKNMAVLFIIILEVWEKKKAQQEGSGCWLGAQAIARQGGCQTMRY